MAGRTESQPNYSIHEQAEVSETQLTFGFSEHHEFISYLNANKTDDGFEPTKEPDPTVAAPGTWEKVEVLAERLQLGTNLWHSEDQPIDLTKAQTGNPSLYLTFEEDYLAEDYEDD